MVIIGGLGSIFGSFAGAAFMVLLPVALKNLLVLQLGWSVDIAAHFEFIIIGGLIIFFLIVEPHGLAQLWNLLKQKRYFAAGEDSEPVIKKPPTLLLGEVIMPVAE